MPGIAQVLTATTQGVQVVAKTQFGPEVTVYDNTGAAAPPGVFSALLGPVGVQVRDPSGTVLYSAGTWPDTNPVALGAVIAAVAALVYIVYKGIR